MNARLFSLVAAGILPVAVACSSSSSGDGPSAAPTDDAGQNETSTPDGSTPAANDAAVADTGANATPDATAVDAAGAACAANPVDAPIVTSTVEAGSPPTMMGGPIHDGKYWRTAQARYGGSQGVTMVAERLDISGDGTIIDDATHETAVDHRGGFIVMATGNNFMINGICGEFAGVNDAQTYTATATTLVTLTSAGRLTTYTKQ